MINEADSEFLNNTDYDMAYEKLFMPEIYDDCFNYTTGKAFAISNEQLAKIFARLNLSNKKVLTVGSSGDQAINAILRGSKDITIIDANIFARYFIEYKLAVIKIFDFKTFNEIFIKHDFFEWHIYAKISHLLSPQVKQFWDTLMLDLDTDSYSSSFNARAIKDKMLMIDHNDRHSKFYRNEKTYNMLQQLLNQGNITIQFITAEFSKFPTVLKCKYDFIYLSNIYDYYAHNRHSFSKIVDMLYERNLNPNGKIVANYDFDRVSSFAPSHLGKHKITTKEILRYSHGAQIKDTAWIIIKPRIKHSTISKQM